MAKKQTAVDWLVDKLIYDGIINVMDAALGRNDLYAYILQAKAMERKQIVEAHGNKTKKSAGVENYIYTLTGEQYYKQTYETNDKGTD